MHFEAIAYKVLRFSAVKFTITLFRLSIIKQISLVKLRPNTGLWYPRRTCEQPESQFSEPKPRSLPPICSSLFTAELGEKISEWDK